MFYSFVSLHGTVISLVLPELFVRAWQIPRYLLSLHFIIPLQVQSCFPFISSYLAMHSLCLVFVSVLYGL